MMNKEKQFLKIIKFAPPIFATLVSLFTVLFFYFENKKTFNEEKKGIEEKYILKNKENVEEEVNRVYNYIKYIQETTEIELKNNIKNRVYEAHMIATNIYEKYKSTKTKEEIFELIKVALNSIRFNEGRGYFFTDDIYGNKLSYPIDPTMEGKNFLHFQDVKGYKLFESIVKTIKDKSERFDEYYWPNPTINNQVSRKISFYKYFEPLNIAIGTGEYFDDFEKSIQQKTLDYINMIRFGKTGYIFVINYDGVYLSHIRKEYIGKNYIENNDTQNIKDVINELMKISKSGSGFYSYIQNLKPNADLPTKKISYVKGLEGWNWMIGAGFYEDDVNEQIEEIRKKLDEKYESYIKTIFIIWFFLTIILLVISLNFRT